MDDTKEALNQCLERFPGKDNYGRPREEYVRRLFAMTDKELEEECEKTIWLSAYANNNPRSDFHWQCDVCYAACGARDGGKATIYSRVHK